MAFRRTLVFAAALLLALLAAVAPAQAADRTATVYTTMAGGSGTLEVFEGVDRYDTARRIVEVESAFAKSCKGVIVCSCNDGRFADALSAAGLAGVLGYPVLTVNGDALTIYDHTALAAECARCPSRSLDILVVGSRASVSASVEKALGSYGKVSKRFAGADRYETNRLVYEYGASHGGWSSSFAFIARGDAFSDALAIAPFLVHDGCPIALVDPAAGKLPSGARKVVAGAGQVIALGDTRSVPAQLLEQAGKAAKGGAAKAERLAGANRYKTAAAIVGWELAHGMTLEGAGIATGQAFPDALASSFLLGRGGSVLMLVAPTGSNAAMTSTVKRAASTGRPTLLRVFGSTASVPKGVRSKLASAAGWSSVTTFARGGSLQSRAVLVKSATVCNQMILVEATGTSATVSLHARNSAGMWSEWLSTAGFVGWYGVGAASEGTYATPAGSFDIPFAFGNASNPGTSLSWHGTTWDSTWVTDPDSAYYNTWQETSEFGGERLRAIGAIYDYALVIGYNHPRYCTQRDAQTVPGAGSAFFLHCSEGKPTSGCVSIPTADMRRLLKLVKPGCRIVIGTPQSVYIH